MEATLVRIGPVRLSCFAHSLQLVVKDGMRQLASARLIMAKCCKMSSFVHQSFLFRGEFEKVFGVGRTLPDANATRWSSLFQQLSAVCNLHPKLKQLNFT